MSENKKYEFVPGDTITTWNGHTLTRIRALVEIGALVAAGDLGGYIEEEGNLSVSGDAWVYGNSRVYGDARVYGNARVYGDARVYGNARVYGDARVSGNAWVYGDALVSGNAWVYGNASILWVSNVGSEYGTLTVSHGKDGLVVSRGCFIGSDDEFLAAVADTHGHESKIGREYALLIEFARLRLGDGKAVEVSQ